MDFSPRKSNPTKALAQQVVHIGNMLSTYTREVVEKDLSSPPISEAVRIGVVKKDELGEESTVPQIRFLDISYRQQAENCVRKSKRIREGDSEC
ncbi:MAG TPA: hypothetical protein VFE96_06345 [Candidatus Bathyarchaeia archaeon]|nr:hypothetical protein [Candidatus Bathyarchaeia archaeon]